MAQFQQFFVSKLARSSVKRRDLGACLLFLLLAAPDLAANEQSWHPTADIAAAATSYLQRRIGSNDQRTTLSAAGFDSRHRLVKCDKPLQGFLRPGSKIRSRTIVGVRCNGTRPWKVYVPVDVAVVATVLVADRALPKGHLLQSIDVRKEQRDVSRLRYGYLSDPTELAGQRLRSPLIAGTVLTPANLEADDLIRRGQSVTIVAANSGIDVNMAGKALADGGLNQRIRVENLNSGRIIEGVVRSSEHVEVLLAGNTNFLTAGPKVSPNPADTRSSNNDR